MLVILGPLAASPDWAKKRKVAVNITSTEMTTLWKLAMVKNIGDGENVYGFNEVGG